MTVFPSFSPRSLDFPSYNESSEETEFGDITPRKLLFESDDCNSDMAFTNKEQLLPRSDDSNYYSYYNDPDFCNTEYSKNKIAALESILVRPQNAIQRVISQIDALATKEWTPDKNYAVSHTTKKNGYRYFQVQWTPSIKKAMQNKSVVYRFKNELTSERCVGATTNLFSRISKYMSEANRLYRGNFVENSSKLSQALAASDITSKFVVGVICTASNSADLDEKEKTAITVLCSIKHGYNIRNGGGGGTNQQKLAETVATRTLEERQKIAKILIEKFNKAPLQPFFFESLENRTKIFLSEEVLAQPQSTYIIEYTTTTSSPSSSSSSLQQPQHDLRKIYVGYCTGNLKSRIASHIYYGNHIEKIRSQRQELYHHLYYSPQKCTLKSIDTSDVMAQEQVTTPEIENILIDHFQHKKVALFNKTKGKNGGVGKNSSILLE